MAKRTLTDPAMRTITGALNIFTWDISEFIPLSSTLEDHYGGINRSNNPLFRLAVSTFPHRSCN
jgi:hypothetical protein